MEHSHRNQKEITPYSLFPEPSNFKTAQEILAEGHSEKDAPRLENISMPPFTYYANWSPGDNGNKDKDILSEAVTQETELGPVEGDDTNEDKSYFLKVDNSSEGEEEVDGPNESSEAGKKLARTRRVTRFELNKRCRKKAQQEKLAKEKSKQKISEDIDRLEDILEEIEKEAEVKKNKKFRKVKETTKESTQKDIVAEVAQEMQRVHETELGSAPERYFLEVGEGEEEKADVPNESSEAGNKQNDEGCSYNPPTSEIHQDILAEAMQNYYKTLVRVGDEFLWNLKRQGQKNLSRERRIAKKERQVEKQKKNQKKK